MDKLVTLYQVDIFLKKFILKKIQKKIVKEIFSKHFSLWDQNNLITKVTKKNLEKKNR